MKIIRLFVLLGAAFVVLGGCSTTPKYADADRTQQQRMDAKTRSLNTKASGNEATTEEKWRKHDRNCRKDYMESIVLAKKEAMDHGKPASAWEEYHLMPRCMVIRKELIKRQLDGKPVVLPANLGLSVAQVSNMDMEELCQKVVAQAVAGKSVAAVLGDRSVAHNMVSYDEIRGECVIRNQIRELRRLRWSDFFYGVYDDRPGHEYRRSGIGLGVKFRKVGGTTRSSTRQDLMEKAHGSNYRKQRRGGSKCRSGGPTLSDAASRSYYNECSKSRY